MAIPAPKRKQSLAFGLELAGLNAIGLTAQRLWFGSYFRAINYHDVPRRYSSEFDAQLQFFARHFDPVSLKDLESFLAGSHLPKRPGLILTFDDGLRTHYDVVAPALERHGLVGWFFLPTGFLDAPAGQQREFAKQHQIDVDEDYPAGERVAVSWDEAGYLARRHVVGCHTVSHRRLASGLDPETYTLETIGAKVRLEQALGISVSTFGWVGGNEAAYSSEGAAAIRAAAFRLAFMTNSAPIRRATNPLQLQRSNIEAFDPLSLVKFQLSGFMDIAYAAKRRRVNRLTALGASS